MDSIGCDTLKSIGILYLGDFKSGEEKQLSEFVGLRARTIDELTSLSLSEAHRWIVRAERFSATGYERLEHALNRADRSPVTSFQAYNIISHLAISAKALATFSPPTVVVARGNPLSSVVSEIKDAGLQTPLFVRSEVESASKYVGFSGCIVHEISVTGLRTAIEALDRHVRGYTEIAFKEVWDIKTDPRTSAKREYRTVGFRGHFVAVDSPSGHEIRSISSADIAFMRDAYRALARGGADGLHVLDFGVRADEASSMFVVEWKDFSSSSLRNVGHCIDAATEAIGRGASAMDTNSS